MKNFPNVLPVGNKEVMLDGKRLLLQFSEPTTLEKVSSIIKELHLLVEEGSQKKSDEKMKWNRINHSNTRFWVKSSTGEEITDEIFVQIESKLKKKVKWIGPVYTTSQGEQLITRLCPVPDAILIEKSDKMKKRQDELIKKYQLKEIQVKSKHLTKFRYLQLENLKEINAYHLREILLEKSMNLLGSVRFESIPMLKPNSTTIPNDTLWVDQWNMTQVNAPDAWDISSGANTTVICILDEGCDLTHPDLQFSEDGINLGTMLPTGAPTGDHGTACAGIAAASFNNNEGVAGLAGDCLIMPVAFDTWSDVEVANGINYASTNGAVVISMSFGWNPWDPAIIDPEIQNAFTNDVVMCVATHNYNSAITYPATNPLVLACGASSTDDNRKSPTSPDGENWWGSDFGDIVYNGVPTGVSVVAPGVLIPTTDRQGADGYEAGNYVMDFNGTSSATPLVAGLAALIRSQYPTLTNVEVRNIIERTAAKVGTLPYADDLDFPNGTRNEEMGYGRIDAFQALNFADVMIKDYSGDDGTEPSTPPSNNWWSYSDIVVRITDDNLFNPSDPAQSKSVERGQTNYIYVQVTNNGPHDAQNVVVDFRITPYVGLQFVYPDDWTLEDAMHVRPTAVTNTFATVASGATVMAKFTISSAQTDSLYGWQYVNPWHPCLLALVTSDNDYAFASSDLSYGNLVLRKNNIAQRNLSVIDVLANSGATAMFSPFAAGNFANLQRKMYINVDISKLPLNSKAYLSIDDDGSAFPLVNYNQRIDQLEIDRKLSDFCCCNDRLVFLNKAKVRTRLGCCDTIVTFEKGSAIDFVCATEKPTITNIQGGNLLIENNKRVVEITGNRLVVELQKSAGALMPMSVKAILPPDLPAGNQYTLSVSQKDENKKVVGGADTVYQVVEK